MDTYEGSYQTIDVHPKVLENLAKLDWDTAVRFLVYTGFFHKLEACDLANKAGCKDDETEWKPFVSRVSSPFLV